METVLCIEEEVGMGCRIECETCGLERTWRVKDCRLCEVIARNVALEEEVREVRGMLGEARQQLGELRQQVWEQRGVASVRTRVGAQSGQGSESGQSPREQGNGGWKIAVGGGKGRVSPSPREAQVSPSPREAQVVSSNRFSVLAAQEEEEVVIEVGGGAGDRTPEAKVLRGKGGVGERKVSRKLGRSQEVLVVGDSRIRYLDRTFCEADRKGRMTCCLPGAGVKDVTQRFRRIVKGTGEEALVVVHVGVNDVRKVRSEELVERYRELLREVKESGRRCVVSGVLPRQKVGGLWLSQAIGLNDRLRRLCGESRIGFMDEWDRFYGRQDLYARDGIHFSRKGVQEFSECIERVVRQYGQGN